MEKSCMGGIQVGLGVVPIVTASGCPPTKPTDLSLADGDGRLWDQGNATGESGKALYQGQKLQCVPLTGYHGNQRSEFVSLEESPGVIKPPI